jgi:hypothetical protein
MSTGGPNEIAVYIFLHRLSLMLRGSNIIESLFQVASYKRINASFERKSRSAIVEDAIADPSTSVVVFVTSLVTLSFRDSMRQLSRLKKL